MRRNPTAGWAALMLWGQLTLGMEYYVAPDGDDSSPGSAEKPFRTIHAAKNAVRKAVETGLTEDVTVVIRGGTYRTDKPLVFAVEDSGTKEHSITYTAASNEVVSVIGGTNLTRWSAYRDHVWEAQLPDGIRPNQVFENGTRMVLARWPDKEYLSAPRKEDYLSVDRPTDPEGKSFLYYREHYPARMDPRKWDISEAQVVIWAGNDWFTQENRLTSVDADERKMTMGDGGGTKRWSRYFVRNVPELLDTAGECQINLKKRRLYVWPRKEPIDRQVIVVPAVDHLVWMHGRDGTNVVRNVHLRSLDLGVANQDVVRMDNVERCSVKFCTIENGGGSGVLISEAARGVLVYGNLIRFNGWHGVSLAGPPPGGSSTNSRDNVVENNHIHHGGMLAGHAYGVNVRFSVGNRIAHNSIHDLPRYGILLQGMEQGEPSRTGKDLDKRGERDPARAGKNVVAYNEIHHVNTDSQDAGAITAWYPGRGNSFHHNAIHDVGSDLFTLQSGIYLDDGSEQSLVESNVVWNVRGLSSYCIHVKGLRNVVRNNVLAATGTHAALRSGSWREETAGIEYSRNIVCFEQEQATIHVIVKWTKNLFSVCDDNVYHKQGSGDFLLKGQPPAKTYSEWRALLGGQYDKRSIVADPMFVDPAKRDYRLRPGSPALKLGFTDIDTTTSGLLKDFPSRFERE